VWTRSVGDLRRGTFVLVWSGLRCDLSEQISEGCLGKGTT
jgi:hypothetical protein